MNLMRLIQHFMIRLTNCPRRLNPDIWGNSRAADMSRAERGKCGTHERQRNLLSTPPEYAAIRL
jgi:hypothetical protein